MAGEERVTRLSVPEGRPVMPPNVVLRGGEEVGALREQVARLTQGCLAADALISSLLAYRPGATDELLIEVRDFLRAAVACREQGEKGNDNRG